VDPIRLGLSLRALRIRRGWRQEDLGSRVGLSHGSISNLERGRMASLSIGALERVVVALDGRLDVTVRWRGEQLDRLLDESHARLVEAIVSLLSNLGWDIAVEVTFAVFAERGSIDVLAWHPRSRTLLVIEAKTVMPDAQAMLATLDRKTRLAPGIAAERGWNARTVARLIVFEGTPVARQRVQRIDATLRVALPSRGASVRRWVRAPDGPMAGLLFVRTATPGSTNTHVAGRQRVRRLHSAANASPGGDSSQSRPTPGRPP
jgi:transcriptional regulator with XRE-family HTH domain